ncbi:MAG TPA: ChaN family lipoprotein [Gammaproteobacteria bacterium]|nr:ChaN family lipoprotein [Gammaproteobacteria bacterium]
MQRFSAIRRALTGGLLIAAALWPWLYSRPAAAAGGDQGGACVPVAKWVFPGKDDAPLTLHDVLQRLSGTRVVLLGEHHDNPEHHRWQLQTLAALYGQHPNMVIGFEMFPRRVQPVLDRWVRGELTEKQFLKQTDWDSVWSFDPRLYMPIFNFARMNRIPMIAINLDGKLISRLRTEGLGALSADQRTGLTKPAPASDGYLDMLKDIYQEHGPPAHKDLPPPQLFKEDKHFHMFVEGQLWWDRVMASGLAEQAKKPDPPFVVGLMGSGHLIYHYGIPHQLDDLGISDSAVLIPWDGRFDCKDLDPKFADVVFGVRAPVAAEKEHDRPLLGVYLKAGDKGPEIAKVISPSVAEKTGIKRGDTVLEMAGRPVKSVSEVIDKVHGILPGTWLPMVVMRDNKRIDMVAKFPPLDTNKNE